MRSLNGLAWRNLKQHRARTLFSGLAVALGAAVVVAAEVVSKTFLALEKEGFVAFAMEIVDGTLTTVGTVLLVAAGFLVFNAFAMSVTQRKSEIGALRALGVTRRQVMRLVLIEAMAIGGAGTLLGLLTGPLIGRGLIALIQSLAGDFFKGVLALQSASPERVGLAAILGLGTTTLSTLLPAWQATRIAPLEALRPATSFPQRSERIKQGSTGCLLLAALSLYLLVAPPSEWILPPWDVTLTGIFILAWLSGLALTLSALVGAIGRVARPRLGQLWGATGQLIADNLTRARRRVTLTVITISVGLAMIVGITGILTFSLDVLLEQVWNQEIRALWVVSPFDFAVRGPPVNFDRMQVPPALNSALKEQLAGQAEIVPLYAVEGIPELALLPRLGTALFEASDLRGLGRALFNFYDGSWATAWPHLDSPCGLLLAPVIARENGVWLGDVLTIQSPQGPIACTVAGIGSSVSLGAVISTTRIELFEVETPLFLFVRPLPGTDAEALGAELTALMTRHSQVWLFRGGQVLNETQGQFDNLRRILNGLLLLAIMTAALGVVNTTLVSVSERRRELGLLRAVGATRRQVQAIVMGEAALLGLIGGGLGLVAGAGVTVILAVVAGGNSFGIKLAPWPAAGIAVRPALLTGLVGLVAAPLISAGAAWLPTRALSNRTTLETLRER